MFNGLERSGEDLDLIDWRISASHAPEPGSELLLRCGLFGLAIFSGLKLGARGNRTVSAA